jgi:predicted metal-dependent hydrolase
MIRGNSGAWGDGATTTVHAIAAVGLRRLAERELPARLMEMAASLGHQVSRVTIRDQRSRWGSCSPSGRISLNWRLIQVPPSVRDYVLLHELTHLVESNHSPRFWKKLEAVCPWHREARTWLRARPLVP